MSDLWAGAAQPAHPVDPDDVKHLTQAHAIVTSRSDISLELRPRRT